MAYQQLCVRKKSNNLQQFFSRNFFYLGAKKNVGIRSQATFNPYRSLSLYFLSPVKISNPTFSNTFHQFLTISNLQKLLGKV